MRFLKIELKKLSLFLKRLTHFLKLFTYLFLNNLPLIPLKLFKLLKLFLLKICTSANFVVPLNICLGFNPYTIPSSLKPFCSPVRLSPAIGVMSGAHYRTSIQDVLHPEIRSSTPSEWSRSSTVFASSECACRIDCRSAALGDRDSSS